MKTFHVNWYGAFTPEEADGLLNPNSRKEGLSGNGLYAWTGKIERQRKDACLLYIGITTESYSGRFGKKHKHRDINRDKYVWLGKIQHQKSTKSDLEAAEYLLVSYCRPKLNEQKLNLPQFPCTVISKFLKKDETEYQRVPLIIREIPEVIIWNSETGKIRTFSMSKTYTP